MGLEVLLNWNFHGNKLLLLLLCHCYKWSCLSSKIHICNPLISSTGTLDQGRRMRTGPQNAAHFSQFYIYHQFLPIFLKVHPLGYYKKVFSILNNVTIYKAHVDWGKWATFCSPVRILRPWSRVPVVWSSSETLFLHDN